ncbi:unannotated protein [freshwater metagenome]|uniref:Unannotated protein n=1 Tax=freshwater metagenome TaxID=449393 RepID=A0A6J6JN88_9ZZZZ
MFPVALAPAVSMAEVHRAETQALKDPEAEQVISELAFHSHPESLLLAVAEVGDQVLVQAVEPEVD